jgi:hypothetical protein
LLSVALARYSDDTVTILSLVHSDGGKSVWRRDSEFLSMMSSSSGSTPIWRR